MVSEEITPDPPSRHDVHTLQDQQPHQIVTFDCGCIFKAVHMGGEIGFTCQHLRRWIVTPSKPQITYTYREVHL